jgi:hypothetical protein
MDHRSTLSLLAQTTPLRPPSLISSILTLANDEPYFEFDELKGFNLVNLQREQPIHVNLALDV